MEEEMSLWRFDARLCSASGLLCFKGRGKVAREENGYA